MFGPLIQKIALNIMIGDKNRVMIVLNIMNGDQDRVKMLCVQYRGWKQGKHYHRKNPGEHAVENMHPSKKVPPKSDVIQ